MRKLYTTLFSTILLVLALGGNEAKASHAMGADLTYNCIGPNQFRVRLSFYRDCSGITPSSSYNVTVSSASCGQNLNMTLNLLAGYPVEVSPLCPTQLSQSTCNGGTLPGVQQYVFEGNITLPMQCTDWVFSWYECCRNSAITTLASPGSEGITIWASLNNVVAPCNNSPDFTTLPVPYICNGQNYIYNHGAVDPDGDSLVYTLVNAMNTNTVPVVYGGGFSGTNPMTSVPAVTINSTNGNVTMNPTGIQVAVVTVRVDEYRNGVLIGSVMRDIQVTVMNCTNNPPTVSPITSVVGAIQTGPFSMEVCPGTPISFTIPGTDPNNGQTFTMTWNNGIPGGTFTGGSGVSPATVNGTFSWTPTVANIGLNSIIVQMTDNACPVIGTANVAITINVLDRTYAGPDQVYCTSGGPVQLNATGGSVFNWTILSGTAGSLSCTNCASPMATPTVPTTYVVQSNLSGLCINRDTVVVTPVPSFALAMTPNQTICTGGSTAIGVAPAPAGSYTYSWSPATALSATNVASPTANPTATTTYTVTVTSAAGCVMSGSTTVTVDPTVLNPTTTAVPPQSCQGAPVTLTTTVASSCDQYNVSSIAFAPTAPAGTAVVLGDDQVSGAIPIGFNFSFFCQTKTQVYIGSNGFITFNAASGSGCCSGGTIPTGTLSDFIAGTWNDLYPPAGGSIQYQTTGVSPNRIFTVYYNGINHCCSAGPINTFEIRLYETTNVIEIHSTTITDDGSTHTMGIQGTAGTGYAVPGRSGTNWTATNDAYRFTPIAPPAYTITWQAPLGNTIGTGGSIVVTPGSTTTYYAITSTGVCNAGSQVTVDVMSVNAGPDQTICPGDNANLNATYTGPPPPSACNVYTVSNIPFAPLAAGGTSVTLGDDQVSTAIPIGFNFTFFCQTKTQVYISSNGFITFNAASGSGCCSGSAVPTATLTDFIAGTWNDLYPPAGGSIQYQTVGTSPNRIFVVTYTGINHCCSAGPINTFQILLYETTNIIEIHSTTITDDGSFHTMAIGDATGAAGYAVPGRNGTNWTATNDAYRFSPQVSTLIWSWSPGTYLTSTSVSNPTANNVGGNITYTVTLNNGFCVMQDQVTINTTCALSVDLLNFNGVKNGNVSDLFWTTTREENTDHFVVERSIDNQNFTAIGQRTAMGAPNSETDYTFTDLHPANGVNYYRLRIVDENGDYDYSNVVEIRFGGAASGLLSVFPNPANETVQFQLSLTPNATAAVELFNVTGVKVFDHNWTEEDGGIISLPVDLSKLPAGSYLYRVKTGDEIFNGKLEVTH